MNIFFADQYGKSATAVENTFADTAATARFMPNGLGDSSETYLPVVEYVAVSIPEDSDVAICFKCLNDGAQIIAHLPQDLVLALADIIKSR